METVDQLLQLRFIDEYFSLFTAWTEFRYIYSVMRGRRWRQRHRKHDFTNLVPRVFFLLLEVAKRPWERGCRFTCCGNPPQFPQVPFGCHRIKVIVPDVQTRRKSARKHCSSPIFFFHFPFSQCLSKMSRNVPTLFGMISRTLRSTCRVLLLPFLKRFQGLRALSLRRKSSRILHDYKCLRELSIFLCL